jgi:hypothetical protein
MKRIIPIFLCVLGVLHLCSCSSGGNPERGVPQTANELDADTNGVSQPDQPQATNSQANPYEGILDNQPVIHRVRAGQPGEDGWCLAKPTRGNFSVMLPGLFIDTMIKSKTLTGGTGVMHTVMTKSAEGVEFNVLQTEIIGELPEESAVDLILERFKELGATVTKVDMIFADQPAVRMRVKAQGVAAEFIHLSSSNSFYMLAIQSRPPQPDNPKLEADTERFFLSFKILNGGE